MSFELFEFQLGTIKLTCNLSVHNPQISIIHHDHIAFFTWLSTPTIVHQLKRSNFSKRVFQLKIKIFVHTKNSKDRSSLTSESELDSFCEDFPIRHSPVKSPFLHLIFSSSFEPEESSLEKLMLLKAAHAQDMIFWNLFFFF
jgi:hypothetical protein